MKLLSSGRIWLDYDTCCLVHGRIITSVDVKEFLSKENHGLLELQLMQTVLVILHCKQFEQNGIIAACLRFLDMLQT